MRRRGSDGPSVFMVYSLRHFRGSVCICTRRRTVEVYMQASKSVAVPEWASIPVIGCTRNDDLVDRCTPRVIRIEVPILIHNPFYRMTCTRERIVLRMNLQNILLETPYHV